ncbi:DUF4105 domain-containing protein [Mesobacterium sp. TK19101]|uniref:DUF4105 domain-containing protein n=1 Tax=Mesobacterium hydrothermale TaxID=3111907 RepID=A0ABU6HDW3_9RHOB|nr:DUF4105 domain-containing protein [Mesobacterium sp. TK19101]MEC3860653.1 DUF4105 domain-containing protein [Mesobacterium sp. TK19101]
MTRVFSFLLHSVFGLLVLAGAAWSATAIWLHMEGMLRILALAGLTVAVVGAALARRRSRWMGWAVFGVVVLTVGGWYQTITPSQSRDWAVDVARGVKAQVDGDRVTLRDLRDFDWRSETEAEPRWISRDFDLTKLQSLDMLTSVWANPDIAHLLVSFGFEDGEQVVFSVEIRREAGESFNEIGGFFRQFELVLIGATEDDIVKLRTNFRKEDVSLYPVRLSPEQMREMFMAYVELAQDLDRDPAFYNTLTANCTTVVYQLAKVLKSDLPLDRELVLSGRLPEYLNQFGVMDDGDAIRDRKIAGISERAQGWKPGQDFSAVIRGR